MCNASMRDMFFGRLPRLASLTFSSAVLSTVFFSILSIEIASAQYCTRDQCDECNLRQCSQRCCHELPELWLINTRCAPRCKNLDTGFNCLTYKRYDRRCRRWVRQSAEDFLAQESSKPTLFYSHGNSLNHKNAMKSCWLIYCKMRCCPGPKRLVFWSWPAERVYKTKRFRIGEMIEKNLRIKYVYAEYQGYYMAKLVHRMSLSRRVMLSGHSYGAITAAAALHYLGGGCLRGLTLDGGAPTERPNLRAGIISGAFDNDMLITGHRYGQAFVAGEKIFVTRNINDRTLKKWPNTSWTGRRATGVTGVNANCLGEHRSKLCQQTTYPDVGTSHYLKPHLKSARFVSALCCLSFPRRPNCRTAAVGNTTVDHAAADDPTGPEFITESVPDEQLAAEEELVAESIINQSELEEEPTVYREDFANDPLWAAASAAKLNLGDMDLAAVFGANDYINEYSNAFSDQRRDTKMVAQSHIITEPQLPLLEKMTDAHVETLPAGFTLLEPLRRERQQAESLPSQPLQFQSVQSQSVQFRPSQFQPRIIPSQQIQPSNTQRSHIQPNTIQSSTIQPSTIQPSMIQSNRIQSSTIQSGPAQPSQFQPSQTAAKPQKTASSGQGNFWFRCGLCLALILASKLYIFFGKRLPAS